MIYIVVTFIVVLILVLSNTKSKQTVKKQKTQKQIEIENQIIKIIENAIEENKRLFITYTSSYGYSGEEYTERIVSPINVYKGKQLNDLMPLDEGEWLDDEFYLFAYCNLRKEERHFRIDRIQNIKII